MKMRMFQWFLIPALLATGNALYGWGALTQVDDLGPIAERSANREAPLVWTFMQGGRWLIEKAGMQDAARAHGQAVFSSMHDAVVATPNAAIDTLFNDSHGGQHRLLLWSHALAPWLWLFTAIAFAMRQKAVVSTRSLR